MRVDQADLHWARPGNYYDGHTMSDGVRCVVTLLGDTQICSVLTAQYVLFVVPVLNHSSQLYLNFLVFAELSLCQKNDDLVNDIYDKKNKQDVSLMKLKQLGYKPTTLQMDRLHLYLYSYIK